MAFSKEEIARMDAALAERGGETYEVFDKKRKVLIKAYEKARTPQARLRGLAAIMRQQARYFEPNIFSGWDNKALFTFADEIDGIAAELEDLA